MRLPFRLNAPTRIAALTVALILAVLLLPEPGAAAPAERHLTLDMTQFTFTPGRIEVNRGDRVTLTLTASDVVHGFYLDGYGIEQRVEPGIPQQITFTAEHSGKFRFRCSVSCGTMHPFMIGELVVGPNTPFWRAGGAIGIALAGLFIGLWRRERSNEVNL